MPTTRSPRSSPDAQAERYWRAGVEHARAGRWHEAAKSHARAAQRSPRDALYWLNLSQAWLRLGDSAQAADAAERALAIEPDNEIALRFSVTAQLERHRYADALAGARALATRDDATHGAWRDYAVALARTGRLQESVGAFMRGLALKPDDVQAYVELCNVFQRLQMHGAAVECLRTALALRPGWAEGLTGVVYHSLFACDWRHLDADLEAVRTLLATPGAEGGVGPFMFLSFGADGREQRRVYEAYARRAFAGIPALPAPADRSAGGRIRVGYLSSDFRQHATAMLLTQVFELHDRERFDVRLYACNPSDGSVLRRRMEAACDAFVDVSEMSDRETAQRIRDDGVEILVDLKGYTLEARPRVMAMRPAPVQVAWLGFPGTLGAPFIDYAIVDPVTTPPSMAATFTERLAWMPDCYQPNDRLRDMAAPPGRAACGLPEDAFVFCCFNHTYKIRPAIFDVWCRLLDTVPGSVLWLLKSNDEVRGNLLREAAARGIDASRIVFAPFVASADNLARLVHADLFLDTLPVNAHTTASDALWAGVPVLTCVGDSFVGRVAASLLHAVGLPELVVEDLAGYESLARSLAQDPDRLAALRRQLARARDEAPLFDSLRTTRELEGLLGRMAERHRAGLPPVALEPRRVLAIGSHTPIDVSVSPAVDAGKDYVIGPEVLPATRPVASIRSEPIGSVGGA